jgi:hypothetical protein
MRRRLFCLGVLAYPNADMPAFRQARRELIEALSR